MEAIEATKNFYDRFSNYLKRDISTFNLRQHAALETAKKHLRKSDLVLEVGCGIGIMARSLADYSGFILATDLSPENIQMAKRILQGSRADAIQFDVISDPLEPIENRGPFDLILMFDAIEHIPRDKTSDVIERLSRLLAPGGRLCLTFPAPEFIRFVRKTNVEPLQIIDEEVDIFTLAQTNNLTLIDYQRVSIWYRFQYVHAVLVKTQDASIQPTRFKGWLRNMNLIWRRDWNKKNQSLVEMLDKGSGQSAGAKSDD